jgi:hypothetical protein
MDARRAALGATDVKPASGQLDLMPLEIAQLRCTEAVAVGDQHHGRVPVSVPTRLTGRRHQPIDLTGGQILARPGNWGITMVGGASTAGRNTMVYPFVSIRLGN